MVDDLTKLFYSLAHAGITACLGDGTSNNEQDEVLMTVWGDDGEDGLWLMKDYGLTPVIWRAGRTHRVATIDPSDVKGSIETIRKALAAQSMS